MAKTQEIAQIEEINSGLNSLNTTLNNTATNYLKLVKTIEDGNASIKESAANLNLVAKVQKETSENTKVLDALSKQLAASEAKLKQLEDGRITTLIENKIAIQQQTKAITDKIKAEQAEEGSLVRMRQKLKELTDQYDKAGVRTKEMAEVIHRLSSEIENAEKATNRHQRGVGSYSEALSKMPGPIGSVISGLQGMAKTLLLLIANPIGAIIAGIVAAFAALGAVFSSTASGGKFIKEVMASIGAIFDVIRERAVILIDAFKALFSGEFRKSADLFSKSVSGMGKEIGNAAREAWNLVDAQSALNKELTFHISESAKEENQIQKLLFLAKDRTKSDNERLSSIKEAMKLSKEQSEREVSFAQRQFEIDTDKAALSAKISGVTGQQLRDFIALGTEEQKTTLASSASLQKMWDLIGGSSKFAPLEESYAKVIKADTEFFATNKRNQSLMTGFIEEIQKKNEEATKNKIEEIQKASEAEIKALEDVMSENEKFLKQKDDDRKSEKQAQDDLWKWLETSDADEIEKFNKNQEEKTKKTKEEADKQKKIEEDLKKAKLDFAKDALAGVFEFRNMAIQKELSALQVEKDAKLSNSKLTTEQRAKLEAEYTKKENALKAKQAQNEKIQALFSIALQTSIGAAKAVAESPLTGGMPFLAWVIAQGVLQAALVAARPVPKYAKGTQSAESRGIFGEAGREVMFPVGGGAIVADKATYFDGAKFKGARIYSNPETERLIGAADRRVQGVSISDERILAGLEKLNKTIANKPVAIFDKDYRPIGQGTSHSQTIYLNRLTRS